MPEGPEVQIICDYLNVNLLGQSLIDHKIIDKHWWSKSKRLREMKMAKFEGVERKAKYIIWHWDYWHWVSHLAMTGGWVIRRNPTAVMRYTRARFSFSGGVELDFIDTRRWGKLEIYDDEEWEKEKERFVFGPDGMGELNADQIQHQIESRVRNTRGNIDIKPVLMEQNFIAGIGNIYASEILHICNISPFRDIRNLSEEEIEALAFAIPEVLNRAYENGGSSIKDFVHPDGSVGSAQLGHFVYGQTQCRFCNGSITKVTQKSRTTYWCQQCQK